MVRRPRAVSNQRGRAGHPPTSRKPSLDDMGPGADSAMPLFRKPDLDEMGRDIAEPAGGVSSSRENSLDEMTVGRTRKTGHRRAARRSQRSISAKKRASPLPSPSSSSGERSRPEDNGDPAPLVRGQDGHWLLRGPGRAKAQGQDKGEDRATGALTLTLFPSSRKSRDQATARPRGGPTQRTHAPETQNGLRAMDIAPLPDAGSSPA